MTMKVPIIGKIELVSTKVMVDGILHEKEKTKVDRFIFRWMGGSEGSIIDISKGYKLFYDDEDKETWRTTFEELVEEATNPDTSNRRSISFTVGSDDDDEKEEEPIVSRTDEGVEDVNSISARKWVTTILGKDDRVIFEMWMAKDLPKRVRAIEIEKKIDEKIGLPASDDGISEFANAIASIDEFNLEPIPGVMVKMNMMVFESDGGEPKMTAIVDLLEIVEEPYNPADFAPPKGYKLVEKN
tara:strand:+ start:5517 stop:6242 length:726 start_codon:yes stop_codon:yes gene_type:complete